MKPVIEEWYDQELDHVTNEFIIKRQKFCATDIQKSLNDTFNMPIDLEQIDQYLFIFMAEKGFHHNYIAKPIEVKTDINNLLDDEVETIYIWQFMSLDEINDSVK